MKRLLFIALQAVALTAVAVEPPFDNSYKPIDGKNCEIIWEATTNHLPVSVKIWKTTPTSFSTIAVSNLLALAELKPNQRKRVDQGGVFADKDVQFYADKTETRCLNLIPSQGFIVISKIGVLAQIPKETVTGVPDGKTALKQTLDILEAVGLNKSELMTNSGGKYFCGVTDTEVLQKDKTTGQLITNIVAREVFLKRQIDGIPIQGNAGISAKFGNEGKLADLSIVWRSIQPEQSRLVPSTAEFINRIRSNRALVYEQHFNSFKRLKIEKVQLYYWESEGSQRQNRIYPYAVLDAVTDLPGDKAKVQLFIPFSND